MASPTQPLPDLAGHLGRMLDPTLAWPGSGPGLWQESAFLGTLPASPPWPPCTKALALPRVVSAAGLMVFSLSRVRCGLMALTLAAIGQHGAPR